MALRSPVLNRSFFGGRVSAQSTMNKHHLKRCHFHSVPIPHLGSATPPRLGPLGPLGARAQHGHPWYIPGISLVVGDFKASDASGTTVALRLRLRPVLGTHLKPLRYGSVYSDGFCLGSLGLRYVEHQVQETTPNSFLSLPIGTDLFLLLPKQLHNILNRLVVNIECQGPF